MFIMNTEKKSFQELINGDKPVLVDFYAEWCGPCKAMMPTVKDVSETLGDKAKVIKIDVDKNLKLAQHYKIMGVPTFIIFQNGEVKWKQPGVLNKAQLLEAIGPFLL